MHVYSGICTVTNQSPPYSHHSTLIIALISLSSHSRYHSNSHYDSALIITQLPSHTNLPTTHRHLPPSALLTSPNLLKPSILITSSITAQAPAIPRKTRDTQLLQTLLTTLRTDGSVLLPIDPVRVLEIAYLLDTYWSQHRLPYPIYFLSPVSARIFADARGMLEWCGTDVEKEFAEKRENPFDFKYVLPSFYLYLPSPRLWICT